MPLSPGSRLGPYEVVAPIGAGGMGEVFRARDTRLDRNVAIKILPPEFAQNAQLKLRFEREARTISQLSHPNICTLYDVGDGYLVMELLNGETLADRIAKGPLPVGQVIRIGVEIANALDRAHKAGVMHRDLKPSNVMLTKSGTKLLDFGLAREVSVLGPRSVVETVRKSLTEEGTIVGTIQYMAPEQLDGAEVDARADIFALGAVLYEMVTGKRAFEGKSKASVIASILGAEPPPITAWQPASPSSLDRLIRTCLMKNPDERWESAHDLATELRWIGERSQSENTPRGRKRSWIPWTLGALLAAIVIALAIMAGREPRQDTMPVVRTAILPPDKTSFQFRNFGAPPAISPDGTKIVFGAAEPGKTRSLWIRSLDSLAPQQLAGTEGASFPFWSPDGRSIAFFADDALKKMDLSGGSPVVVCAVGDGRGGSWSPDGRTIVFAGRYTPISRISASGGSPVTVTKLEGAFSSHRWPEFLPDGEHFLYLASPNGSQDPANAIFVGSTDGRTSRLLVSGTNEPHYLNGCIVFTRDRIITAQRFDLKELAMVGDAFPLREQPADATPLMSRSMVSIARAGTLIYQAGSARPSGQLRWFDRSGKDLGTVGNPAPFGMLAIAPDGKSVLASLSAAPPASIWLFDVVRGVESRVTFNNTSDTGPVWSPDGRKMIYTSGSGTRFRFLLKDLTTGAEETLLESNGAAGVPAVTSWSLDGKIIMYTLSGRTTRSDIWWMSLLDRQAHMYLGTPALETGARLSPDAKWVAYQSNENGPTEVYVAPFPPTGAKWQVSPAGGGAARWRADGKELFYAVAGNPEKLMAVPITFAGAPQFGHPVKLFEFYAGQPGIVINTYDVSRDGQKFLVNSRLGDEPPAEPLIVVQHFDQEIRATIERDK